MHTYGTLAYGSHMQTHTENLGIQDVHTQASAPLPPSTWGYWSLGRAELWLLPG